MKKIAFFDFDGTITTRDTLLEVIRYQKGSFSLYSGFLLNAPFMIALKLKLISNQAAKEKILIYFFKGMAIGAFQQACDLFIKNALPAMLRPGALAEIQQLQATGFEVVVVSASPANWIKKWTDAVGVGLIATELATSDGKLTGLIRNLNNNADEKVRRIKAIYDLSAYTEIYCYGDTGGDKAMLSLGTKAFYKPFRDTN